MVVAGVALFLVSCGGSGTGNGGNNNGNGTTSLTGKVYQTSTDNVTNVTQAVPWAAGQQTVELEVLSSYQPNTTKVISTGTISASGDLNISLPATNIPTIPIGQVQPGTPPDAQSPYTYECTGSFTSGNTSVKTVMGNLKVGNMGLLTGLKDTSTLNDLFPQGKYQNTNLVYADGATS